LALTVRIGLEQGEPVRSALQSYLSQTEDEVSSFTCNWLVRQDQGGFDGDLSQISKNPHRLALFHLLQRGLRGESILSPIITLEDEIMSACMEELEKKTALMPLQALVPLLFLQFPALLILFFSPFLDQLFRSV